MESGLSFSVKFRSTREFISFTLVGPLELGTGDIYIDARI
jgi:hypothetical protein